MYFINTETLKLEKNSSSEQALEYAILSHTWEEEGEVTFQDMQDKAIASTKTGYAKIQQCCTLTRKSSLKYVWINTCCIDKSSSAELSESINFMFKWYGYAKVCYAYLADVNDNGLLSTEDFTRSRWLSRGWTLQELIAPTRLDFYDSNWTKFSSRTDADTSAELSTATGIDIAYLNQPSYEQLLERLSGASVAERMCWASRRRTTREEDIAYCLLGIFAVNMSPLYGEGKQTAFRRLQEEIIKYSDDQSIFAWATPANDNRRGDRITGFLATSPSDFATCGNLVPFPIGSRRSVFSITNKGIHISLPMFGDYAILECYPKDDLATLKTLGICHLHGDTYGRVAGMALCEVDYRALQKWKRKTIYVVPQSTPRSKVEPGVTIIIGEIPDGYETVDRQFTFDPYRLGDGGAIKFDCTLTRDGSRTVLLRIRVRELLRSIGCCIMEYGLCFYGDPTARLGGYLTVADGTVWYFEVHHRTIFGEHQVLVDVLTMRRRFRINLLPRTTSLVCFQDSEYTYHLSPSDGYRWTVCGVMFFWPNVTIHFYRFCFTTINFFLPISYETLLNASFDGYLYGLPLI
ncbi:heterokaryon incompatibility protein-domain-containing protein [Hypoxylon rubiginosum]|uniref:Heterokaryon incompatibility protein-domain-containing protein n=1 Tax=Hypoxylon rubiginosum TaxID=110542 RepID=A0ACB9YRD1_9PEZI|nr:heterokaryon incompatibility protein-domain-containing protein [Hypoxylon rubiginosum]